MVKFFISIAFSALAVWSAFAPNVYAATPGDSTFKAEVVRVLEEARKTDEYGIPYTQQNLMLRGLSGDWSGQQVAFDGISEVRVLSAGSYQVGDRVWVDYQVGPDGEGTFYIVGLIRSRQLLWLLGLFVAVVLLVGRGKGMRALLALGLSALVISGIVVPNVMAGQSALPVVVASSLAIIALAIYLTEGWRRPAHLAVASVALSLGLTVALSSLLIWFTRLTGMGTEEAMTLLTWNGAAFDYRGLLLAGMVISATGVLDDVVVSQIAAVEELRASNPILRPLELFTRGLRVGTSHIGSVINTLFLVYAGASLPYLVLYGLRQTAATSLEQVLSAETIATEIVRTLAGTIGLTLAMPIATALAARFGGELKIKN